MSVAFQMNIKFFITLYIGNTSTATLKSASRSGVERYEQN
jgi:hypothetical protein